ncbi:hypothetical protein Q1695_002204 [Nippostrongylus brasiliensis]|nr:hypothetical protein Q1695_002204 [Nippostrongylus brasiliensis]
MQQLLVVMLAVFVCAQSVMSFQKFDDAGELDESAVSAIEVPSTRFRPLLKRRFVLPRMGMPTYVREGDLLFRS